jgi:hypothetical protein
MSQVILYPCVVTWMSESVPDGNLGTSNRMNIGAGGKTEAAMRTLLRIDLQLIGAATIADTSKLELYDTGGGTDTGGQNYYAYTVLQTAWTEEGATWNTYDGVNAWDAVGCSTNGVDYDSGFQVYSVSLGGVGWQTWDQTPDASGRDLNDILQEAIDNHGGVLDILIRWDVEVADNYSHYDSEESLAGTDTRPKLTIDYSGGDVPNIAGISSLHHVKHAPRIHWTCVKSIAGQPVADVKKLAGVSEH